MRYIVIRNKKSDKLTLHSTQCSVAIKHYSDCHDIERLADDTIAEAIEGVAFHGGKVKICDCAKV